MKERIVFPILLTLVFALSRWPGLMPPNFSAAYAIAFCTGLYFSAAVGMPLCLGILLVTDVLMNVFVYHVPAVEWLMIPNYVAYLTILYLGRIFRPSMNFLRLLGGGVVGALIFYLVTNSGAWLQNPRYAKTFHGWVQALTVGLPEFPGTWEFFRNTLFSGGLFTALFVGAVKFRERAEQEDEEIAEEAGELEAGRQQSGAPPATSE